MFTEQTLTCADCGTSFPFTASEQEFFAEKGFNSPPRRCKPCRVAAKANRDGGGGYGGGRSSGGGGYGAPREMHDVTCSACGVATQVPFRPNGAKPVYCRDCFRK